jgi:hypothetical protein
MDNDWSSKDPDFDRIENDSGSSEDMSRQPHQPVSRFMADAMLGRLARWLRLLGYDTVYEGCPCETNRISPSVCDGLRNKATVASQCHHHSTKKPSTSQDSFLSVR